MTTALVQQPVNNIGTWDGVRIVDRIIDESELGIFINSARLVDQILRDDRVLSTVMTRILGLLGKELEQEPAKDTAQGRMIADEIDLIWPKMFGHSALFELHLWGILQGVGLGQILEDTDPWTLEVWHPWALRWNPWERVYYVQGRGESELPLTPSPGGGFTDPDGRRWVIYTPYGLENVGRRGLVRSLAHLYLERRWAHRDRARYSEVHGQPTRLGVAPNTAKPTEISQFGRDIAELGTEPAIVVRQGMEGEKWDLQLVEAKGKSNELFKEEIAQLDKAIATLVLGQSQSTDGQAGLGSNDQAGELVRLDIMRADASTLADALRAQVLVPYCEFTYGNGEMAPWPYWCVDPPEDRKALADVHFAQAQADKIYIEAGVLTPEEVALSRFGEGDYSLETTIDATAREAIASMSAEQMKMEAQAALDQAKNPAPQVLPAPTINGTNGTVA